MRLLVVAVRITVFRQYTSIRILAHFPLHGDLSPLFAFISSVGGNGNQVVVSLQLSLLGLTNWALSWHLVLLCLHCPTQCIWVSRNGACEDQLLKQLLPLSATTVVQCKFTPPSNQFPKLSHSASCLLPLAAQLMHFEAIPGCCFVPQLMPPKAFVHFVIWHWGANFAKKVGLAVSFSLFACNLQRRSSCDKCILWLGVSNLSKKN